MKRFRNHCLLAVLFAVPAAAGWTGEPATAPATELGRPLTLPDAIQIALGNHMQIGIARSNAESARARLVVDRSAYYPSVTPAYTYKTNNSDHNTTAFQSTAQGTTVGIQQTIFDSGKREIGVAQGRDAVRSADFGILNTRASVILNVTTNWYELLRSKELVRVAEAELNRTKTTLEATQAFVDAGSSAKKDILQAQADFSNANVQAIQARNNVRLAETSLRTAMGLTTPQPIATPDEPQAAPSPEAETRSIAEFVQDALANRPDLKQSEANLASSRRSVRLAAINAGPQLDSTASGVYSAHPNPGIDRIVSVSVTYPLFDAGAARARVREARASLQQAEQQLELQRQTIAADVESAYLKREEARTRVSAAQTALEASRANYESATQSQREGVGTILDVITAENALITAETNAVQAVYDFYTADATLRYAVGSNDPGAAEGGIS